MTNNETVKALVHACRVAGVDAETIFAHFDEADIREYASHLSAPGGIAPEQLPRWMASTAATIADGRCLCRACKGVKA